MVALERRVVTGADAARAPLLAARVAGMGRAEALIGQGLLTSHGAHHDRQRRLAEAAFAPASLAALDVVLRDETARLLATWSFRLCPK